MEALLTQSTPVQRTDLAVSSGSFYVSCGLGILFGIVPLSLNCISVIFLKGKKKVFFPFRLKNSV